MLQKQLTPGKLLDSKGDLCESGYSTTLIKEYNRADIKAGKLRIKEWDYYYIGNQRYGIALTIADNSYMGLCSVAVMDFKKFKATTRSVMTFMPKGKTHLPSHSKMGSVSFLNKKMYIEFINDGEKRQLKCTFKKFSGDDDFSCDIMLYNEPHDSMVIATPFNKPKHFYYNQKINCLKAVGKAFVGQKEYAFDDEYSYGVLDWGRGVWTYKNVWYWSSMSSILPDGKTIGFNLGYGFGCNTNCTENMIFYDGKAYKIDEVTFNIPKTKKKYDYLGPWTITSNDGSVNLEFIPIVDRCDNTSAVIIASHQHQVFGKFSGTLKCGDEVIEIVGLMGFAERVMNKW